MEVINLEEFLKWIPPQVDDIVGGGILQPQSRLLIYGADKSWKSMIAADMCLKIASGLPWFGFKTKPSKVLYINLEIAKASFHKRAVKMARGRKYNTKNFYKATELYLKLDTSFGMNDLDKAVRLCAPDVVVIDPLYRAVSTSINDLHEINKFFDSVDIIRKKYGCAFIIVHHEHKYRYTNEGERIDEGGQSINGSQGIAYWIDAGIRVEKTTPDEANPSIVKVTFTGMRNAEYWPHPFTITIDRDDLSILTAENTVMPMQLSIRNLLED